MISWGKKQESDTGNEPVLKIHKKIKIGIPEIGALYLPKCSEYMNIKAKILYNKKNMDSFDTQKSTSSS